MTAKTKRLIAAPGILLLISGYISMVVWLSFSVFNNPLALIVGVIGPFLLYAAYEMLDETFKDDPPKLALPPDGTATPPTGAGLGTNVLYHCQRHSACSDPLDSSHRLLPIRHGSAERW